MVNQRYIRGPRAMNVSIKGQRGLANDKWLLGASESVTRATADPTELVEVRAGEEARLIVRLKDLPPNADVKRLVARLEVAAADTLPSSQSMQIEIGESASTLRNFQVKVDVQPGLQNVTLRLDGGEVFWTYPGILGVGSQQISDCAEQVNAYLDSAQQTEGETTLVFLLRSDTAGKALILIGKGDYNYTLIQTESWTNELDASIRVDRNLDLGFHSQERLPLIPIDSPPDRIPQMLQLRMDVGGEVTPPRLLGTVEAHDGRQFVLINSEYALAQSLLLDLTALKNSTVQCVGVALYLRYFAEADVYAEVTSDAAAADDPSVLSTPSGGQPLGMANLSCHAPQNGLSAGWQFVPFSAPATLYPGIPYWVVVKGVRGNLQLGLRTSLPTATSLPPVIVGKCLINRGGQLWKTMVRQRMNEIPVDAKLSALVSLVYLPAADNQTAAFEVGIERDDSLIWRHIDPTAQAQSVSFALEGTSVVPNALFVRSHAMGTIHIANVIREYRLLHV